MAASVTRVSALVAGATTLLRQGQPDTERSAIMNPDINYYGIVILLRKLQECGEFTEKELRKIAARIAADNGVEVVIFL